jgi:hypothetical protein
MWYCCCTSALLLLLPPPMWLEVHGLPVPIAAFTPLLLGGWDPLCCTASSAGNVAFTCPTKPVAQGLGQQQYTGTFRQACAAGAGEDKNASPASAHTQLV